MTVPRVFKGTRTIAVLPTKDKLQPTKHDQNAQDVTIHHVDNISVALEQAGLSTSSPDPIRTGLSVLTPAHNGINPLPRLITDGTGTGVSTPTIVRINPTQELNNDNIPVLDTNMGWTGLDVPTSSQNINPLQEVLVDKTESCRLDNNVVNNSLVGCITMFKPDVIIPQSPLTTAIKKWTFYLENDFNKEFLLTGLELGFMIVDSQCTLFKACQRNYKSVLCENFNKTEDQINKEIQLGRYIVSKTTIPVISGLGAVPKKDGNIRLIHDFSQPKGGVNQFCLHSSVIYPTVDQALKLMKPGCFLGKIDLKEAYRSVPIHPNCYGLTGLQWRFTNDTNFTYLYDVRLPFGSSKSCKIFQSLSNAIIRILNRHNILGTGYLDDFMVIGDTEQDCDFALKAIMSLVTELGFTINFNKVSYSTQKMTFLGVAIDTVKRTLSLPTDKLSEVKTLLTKWSTKHKGTKKELQRLLGKLNWCSRVIRGGRTFMRNLFDLLSKVSEPFHYVRINSAAKSDILWWVVALTKFHGTTPFTCDIPVPSHSFSTDACLLGGGGHFKNDWFFIDWKSDNPKLDGKHINILELQTVLESARRWGKFWTGFHILVRSDNYTTVAAINNTTTRSPDLLSIIKELFWLSVEYNFKLSAKHLAGNLNILSDGISRLHNFNNAKLTHQLLSNNSNIPIFCKGHMSKQTFLSLQETWSENSKT